MIVELDEISKDTWRWTDSAGYNWDILLSEGNTPIPAPMSDKATLKAIIKLKDAGFDADEIMILLEKL